MKRRGILERLFLLTITVNLLTAAAITEDDDDQIITTDATGMRIDADEVFTATGMLSDDDDEEFPAHDNDDLDDDIMGRAGLPSVDTTAGSWGRLEVSPDDIGSVIYGNFRIVVYAHTKNNYEMASSTTPSTNRYFYTPLSLLNHKTAVSLFNNNAGSSQKNQVSFDVEMWNDDLQKEVVDWIRRARDKNVNEDLVQIIKFEQVMLSFSCTICFSDRYTLPTTWAPYHSSKSITMRIICYSKIECDFLAKEIRDSPQLFTELRLLLTVDSQTSKTKETKISVESIRSGKMAAEIIHQFEGKDKGFLTAEEEQRFLSESATNIKVDIFDDSGNANVFSEKSKDDILKFVKSNLLDPSRNIIKDIGDKNWEFVYWNPDNYRPDVTTNALNEAYNKLSTENKTKIISEFKSINKFDIEADVKVPLVVGVKGKIDTDFSRSGKDTKEDVNKFLQETKNNVEWNGIKFVPKPMALSRLNLANLRDVQTFKDSSVQVNYHTAILTVGLQTSQEVIKKDVSSDTGVAELKRRIEILEKPVVGGPIVTSCATLKQQGHLKNGFYLVKAPSNNKIIVVYCDFTKAPGTTGYEKVIGFNDIKTSSGVYFYVQRNSIFAYAENVIPYEVERLNIGGAMNLATGVFTAPVNGRYQFSFTARSGSPELSNYCSLRVNDAVIATSYSQSHGYNLPIISTLNLKRGDRVDMLLASGSLLDFDDDHWTHFSGILLEEDINLN